MSENIFQRPGFLATSFYGGTERGPCVQITAKGSLDAFDAKALLMKLEGWLRKTQTRLVPLPDGRAMEMVLVAPSSGHEIAVETFDGGIRGPCVELHSGRRAYVQLTTCDVKTLAEKLDNWLETTGQPAINAMLAKEAKK